PPEGRPGQDYRPPEPQGQGYAHFDYPERGQAEQDNREQDYGYGGRDYQSPPRGTGYDAPGYGAQGYAGDPRGAADQGYSGQGYGDQAFAEPGYPSRGYPSQGYPSQGYPSQGYAPQDHPSQAYQAQDYTQGYRQQDYPQTGAYGAWAQPRTQGVRLVLDDGSGRTFDLRQGSNVIGRGQASLFRIPDTGVSRQHADVQWDGTVALLVDLNSTNGTVVNGTPVTEWQLA